MQRPAGEVPRSSTTPATLTCRPGVAVLRPGRHPAAPTLCVETQCETVGNMLSPRVRVGLTRWITTAFVAFLIARAGAQSTEKEPAAIVELGGAASWSVKGGGSSFGPSAAVEVTPIENWLELEAGVSPLFGRNSTEWDTDLLFKKPWTLSRKTEFMAGVGPEWIHTRESGVSNNSIAGEAALDFMFWPAKRHKFGVYVEPAYEYDFGSGHEQSLGLSGGLLIAVF